MTDCFISQQSWKIFLQSNFNYFLLLYQGWDCRLQCLRTGQTKCSISLHPHTERLLQPQRWLLIKSKTIVPVIRSLHKILTDIIWVRRTLHNVHLPQRTENVSEISPIFTNFENRKKYLLRLANPTFPTYIMLILQGQIEVKIHVMIQKSILSVFVLSTGDTGNELKMLKFDRVDSNDNLICTLFSHLLPPHL